MSQGITKKINLEYGLRSYFCKKRCKKNYFENFTMVPIDKSLIDKKMLNKFEEKWLNEYHNKVYNNLKTFMRKDEIMDLKEACSAI